MQDKQADATPELSIDPTAGSTPTCELIIVDFITGLGEIARMWI